MSHTPGVWEVHRYPTTYYNGPDEAGEPFVVTAPNDGVILAVVIPDAVKQAEANAHLMKAAPTLLEALEELVSRVTEAWPELANQGPVLRAQAAINAAKGDS